MPNSCRITLPAFLALALCGCTTVIEERLSEEQANSIVVALDELGIGADKSADEGGAGSYRIAVSNDDVSHALAALRAAELPQRAEAGIATTFEDPGLVPTETEDRARFTTALGSDVARTLEAMDGVLNARVHIALADTRNVVLDEEAPRPRASVMIKYRGAHIPYEVASVRALVAGAVQGLRMEDVAVVGVQAQARPQSRNSLVHVGPIAVSRGSANALKLFLGTALGLDVILAAALLYLFARRRVERGAEETATSSS